ncbi:MAG: PAS domain-containing protein [Gammaproteobacteria bacterium]|nr:PAS domain-containing protein [Gammaproteobacteria bacterium]NVK89036.1 PAS domain-containing protein [Gammaproteobacteria bacterium]
MSLTENTATSYATQQSSAQPAVNIDQLQNAFEQFNRLSENFVHSYQNLEGQVESLAGQLADEVRKKQAQYEEKERMAARLQNLLAILPAGVVVLDGSGRVQDCNAVAVDFLGRPLLGETWLSIIERSFSPRFDDGYEVSLKDGRRVHIETRSLDYEPGQLIVLTDLTETRKLQDKVNQDKRLSSMGRMMASLAHQVRTPLASALIYAENCAEPHVSAQNRQRFNQKLIHCLQHLERHVTDMLQFAKSGGLETKPLSGKALVKGIESHLVSHFEDLQLSINITNDAVFQVNLDALVSAINNLIENARQSYEAEEQTQAIVKCSIHLNSRRLKISVTDFGCGISEQRVEKIFDPFYTSKAGGTGLGLAVVHGVVKAHNGQIDIDSKPGEGTQVIIQIPAQASVPSNSTAAQECQV